MVKFGMYMKRRTKKRILSVFLGTAVLCAAMAAVYFVTKEIMYRQVEQERTKLELKLSESERKIYAAKADIRRGEIISLTNTEPMEVYASMDHELYFTQEDIGRYAVCDIPQGTYLQKCMTADTAADSMLREVECRDVIVNTNLMENDFVDIRLVLPDGRNYVVIAKKNIHFGALPAEENSKAISYFNLTEEEILNLSSAIADMESCEGAKLYTTKYIEPAYQKASEVTYVPGSVSISQYEKETKSGVQEKIYTEEIEWKP